MSDKQKLAPKRPRGGSGLYAHVVEVLGQEIIDGDLPEGTIVFAEQICERLSVSRSVVREGMRTLSAMGLVEARPQVGTRVLPQSNWDLLNPYVVKWRAKGSNYLDQMVQLLELRLGLEHVAAGLAAQRLEPEHARAILGYAHEMRDAFDKNDARRFFVADAEFHRGILEGTQNAVIAQLASTVAATLDTRANDTRPGMHDLYTDAVERHIQLGEALVARDAEVAQALALDLVELTLADFQLTLAGNTRLS